MYMHILTHTYIYYIHTHTHTLVVVKQLRKKLRNVDNLFKVAQ